MLKMVHVKKGGREEGRKEERKKERKEERKERRKNPGNLAHTNQVLLPLCYFSTD